MTWDCAGIAEHIGVNTVLGDGREMIAQRPSTLNRSAVARLFVGGVRATATTYMAILATVGRLTKRQLTTRSLQRLASVSGIYSSV